MTSIVAAHPLTDPFPEAIKANFDAQQAISASMANTLSECVARFGALQLDATKAALSGSFDAARDFLSASQLPPLWKLAATPADGAGRATDQPDAEFDRHGATDEEGRHAAAAQMHSSRRLRELALYQERAKEEERKRIARELHDELGALLTSVKAHISVAQAHLAAAGVPDEPALATAAELADDAIETVRKVIIELRPSVLDQLGIWAALEWFAGRVTSRNGMECMLSIDPAAAACAIDAERSTVLYRIVQEAVTNALRHAAAGRIEIRATRSDGWIEIAIRDDGKGMDPALNADSFGIAGMRERAFGIGGHLSIASAAGAGTCVTLQLPLEARHAN